VATALGEVEEARRRISEVPWRHPFDLRYAQDLPETAWERCVEVLDRHDVLRVMKQPCRRLSVKGKTSPVSFDCCASLSQAQLRTRTKPEIVYAIDLAPKIRVGTEWAK
jgi:hypothetical protein